MGMKGWTQQRVFRMAGSASIGAALLSVAGDEFSQYSPQEYASLADIERALLSGDCSPEKCWVC